MESSKNAGCSCLGSGFIHVKYTSFGEYVVLRCPDCQVTKNGRLTSATVIRSKTNPRNRAYLKRRMRSDYVNNTGDLP